MIRVLCIAALIAVGGSWPFVLAAAITIYLPWFAIVGLGVLARKHRRGRDMTSRDIRFCRGVADELRSGASLRAGVAAAAEDIGELPLARACRVGRPYSDLATQLREALPEIGPEAAIAIQVAGVSGGPAADTFEALALHALDDQELAGEIRASTAQVRGSATVIGALPVVLLLGLTASGRLNIVMAAGSAAGAFLVTGALLIGLGWLAIWYLIRTAEVS